MSAPRPSWATPAMLTVVAIWACNFIAMRWVLEEVPLLAVGALRFLAAGILLLVVLRVAEGGVGVPRALWGRIFILGVIGNSVYQTLFMVALHRTTVGNTAILLATADRPPRRRDRDGEAESEPRHRAPPRAPRRRAGGEQRRSFGRSRHPD